MRCILGFRNSTYKRLLHMRKLDESGNLPDSCKSYYRSLVHMENKRFRKWFRNTLGS